MGILDDAIREHLDLKRRQGAAEEELARLEDEAFGPPSRPGDPDFERSPEGEAALPGEAEARAGDEGTATATQAPAFHDQEVETDDEPPEHEVREEAGAAQPPVTPADESAAGPRAEGPAGGVETPAGDAEQKASPSGPPEPTGGVEPGSGEAAAPAGEPTVEHDTLGGAGDAGREGEATDVDLDLDLDIDEEIEDVGDLDLDRDEVPGESTGARGAPDDAGGEPIESQDTVEHHFEDAIDEAEVVEDEPAGKAEDEDDVLEETPEFLRDAPEDDELWFEQGEPKDFDF